MMTREDWIGLSTLLAFNIWCFVKVWRYLRRPHCRICRKTMRRIYGDGLCEDCAIAQTAADSLVKEVRWHG